MLRARRVTAWLLCTALAACGARTALEAPAEGSVLEDAGPPPPASPRRRTLAIGWSHACAADEGAVFCWGDTSLRLVGDRDERTALPAPVEGLSNIVEVAVGQLLSCALDDVGRVFCWGDRVGSRVPRQIEALPPAERIFAGAAALCALTAESRVVCTGLSFFEGSCASPSADPNFDVAYEPIIPGAPGSPVEELGVGWRHACARRRDGAVYCWGCSGRLENGSAESRPHRDPIRVEGVSARQLAVGSHAACGVAEDGAATCWGEGSQFGTSVTTRPTPPLDVLFDFAPERIDVGVLMSCAAAGNRIGCIGASFGLPECDSRGTAPQEFNVPDTTELAVGYQDVCARDVDGEIWCWGCNSGGVLGDGGREGRAEPTRVSLR